MLLSIISPVYMAQNIVGELVLQITKAASTITTDFEIVLVEDGSVDDSWGAIEKAAAINKHVRGVKLSRNFGQNFCITAGLAEAKGDFVVVMDCDLQDNPKYIPDLYNKMQEGYDIVYTEKEERAHSMFKNITSAAYNRVYNYLADNHFSKGSYNVGTYSMLSRKVVDAFLSMQDYRRLYLAVLRWVGFKHAVVKIEHQKRYEGKSSYSFIKMWRLAVDGIISQSDKLLRLTVTVGLCISMIAFISVIGIVVRYYFKPFATGWASIASLIVFMGGIVTLSVGICGIYIGKTFEQTKNRPLYIIDKTTSTQEPE